MNGKKISIRHFDNATGNSNGGNNCNSNSKKATFPKNIHRFVLLKYRAKERPQSFLLQSIIKPQFGWNNLIWKSVFSTDAVGFFQHNKIEPLYMANSV